MITDSSGGSGGREDPLVETLHEADRAARKGLGGCLTLLGLALCGLAAVVFGTGAGLKAWVGDADWWGYAAACAVFAAVALLIWTRMGAATESTESAASSADLKALRDAEQASGRVTGVGRAASVLQLWAAGGLTVAVWLGLVVAWRTGWPEGTTARWVLLAGAVMTTTFAVGSIRQARRARAAGSSVLQIDDPPVRPGERFTGRITLGLGPGPREITLKLVCQRVEEISTPGGGIGSDPTYRNLSRKEITPLWAAEQEVPVASLVPAGGGQGRWSFPTAWDLPGDARPTDESDPKDTIQWVLRLTATRGDGSEQADAWEVRVAG